MEAHTTVVNTQDNRKDPRYQVDDRFQVKILFASDDPIALGKVFTCSAVDVSKSGVKIISADPLALKSVLDLRITTKDNDRSYILTGDVKWCTPNIGINHTVGIQLKQRSGTPTDLADWKKMIRQLK